MRTYRVFIKYCVFSEDFKIFWTLAPSVFPLCQCVYTHQAGRTPALQLNWQSSDKSPNFKEKTQYLMNNLYVRTISFFGFHLKSLAAAVRFYRIHFEIFSVSLNPFPVYFLIL